MLYHTVRTK